MSAAFFRGTGIDQNVKFKDKDKELVRSMEFPPEFDQPVDLKKVSRRSSRTLYLYNLKTPIDTNSLSLTRSFSKINLRQSRIDGKRQLVALKTREVFLLGY